MVYFKGNRVDSRCLRAKPMQHLGFSTSEREKVTNITNISVVIIIIVIITFIGIIGIIIITKGHLTELRKTANKLQDFKVGLT